MQSIWGRKGRTVKRNGGCDCLHVGCLKPLKGFFLAACFLIAANFQWKECSAATSPATKLLSGIWTEEGCIVPNEDRSRKLWGVATIWLYDDPINPCNSPCGCPPEGLNPALLVKPNTTTNGGIAPIAAFLQAPAQALPPLGIPPFVNDLPGYVLPPGCFSPGPEFFNGTLAPPPGFVGVLPPPFIGRLPSAPIFPPLVGSLPPLPIVPPFHSPIAPPVFGPFPPLPPHFVGPIPPLPHHQGGFPLPPNLSTTIPILKPVIEKVPIDFGFSQILPSAPAPTSFTGGTNVGTIGITMKNHDKTHLNANFDSDKGSKNTVTTATGSIAAGVPLFVSPPQVEIAAGSTTVAQEDWDKEKFNANYDKDKGSKQTVTTTGGTVGTAGTMIAVPPQAASTGSTTLTQEDWDKEKFSANYDKDKGSKQTVTTTGGSAAIAAPCETSGVIGGTAGTTTVSKEDWEKEKLSANYDKDKGSKQKVTTTAGTASVPGQTTIIPSHVAAAGSTSVTQEDWDKEKLSANYENDKGSKQTVSTASGAVVAAPEPCPCALGTHAVLGGTTTVSQEDWDKQNMNLNYDKDHGSRVNSTFTGVHLGGGGALSPYRPPPTLYGPVGSLPPPHMFGPPQLPSLHGDVKVSIPIVPPPHGNFGALPPPLHHPSFLGTPVFAGPLMPFLPNSGVLPLPPPIPGHTAGPYGPAPPPLFSPVEPPSASSIVPEHGFPPQPLPSSPHHGHYISKLPSVLKPILKPVLEHVIIDLGDSSASPLDNANILQNFSSPNVGPDVHSSPQSSSTQPNGPGGISSILAKIPVIGSLFQPVTVNLGETSELPPSVGAVHPNPNGPLLHTVPVHFGTGPLPQMIAPGNSAAPMGTFIPQPPYPNLHFPAAVLPPFLPTGSIPLPLPPSTPVHPAGIPHDIPIPPSSPPVVPFPITVGTLPALFRPQIPGSSLFHQVLVDFGHAPPLHNLSPIPGNTTSPSLGPLPLGALSVPRVPSSSSVSGNLQAVPIDFGIGPPPQNLYFSPPLSPPGAPPQVTELSPPISIVPLPNQSPPIMELGPPPSLGPRPHGPPQDFDFLPKDPSHHNLARPMSAPVQDPGLTVSKRNRNVLVNRYGGGVILPGSLQSNKCRSGRCNHSRVIKDFEITPEEATSAENHIRSASTEEPKSDLLQTVEANLSPEITEIQSL